MYQKYTTEGFIVAAHASKEADRVYLILTREFGMIRAHATSVRHSKSKLRPHLVEGALLSLTFLRSKVRWRLLEAVSISSLASQSGSYRTFLQIMAVLKSLVHGEEKNESLFESVLELYNFLFQNSSDADLSAAECLAMVKILHSLGYGEPKEGIVDDAASYDAPTFSKIAEHKRDLISGINRALQETGL